MTDHAIKEAKEYWQGSRDEANKSMDDGIISEEYRDQLEYYDFILDILTKIGRGEIVEVVRCKDCRWYEYKWDDKAFCHYIGNGYLTKPDNFCSHGKYRGEPGKEQGK
jgi:hypothetical protein